MGYRTFGDKTTLEDARDYTEYTFEALDAHVSHDVKAFAKPLVVHLEAIKTIEASRRAARRATVRANARVRMRNGDADDAMREFGKDVLAEVRQDRSSPLFLALFSQPVADLVNLSLAPELDEIEGIVAALKDHSVPADLRKKWTPIWQKIVAAGREALADRDAAARSVASASLEEQRWIERADRLRRAIDGALTQFAANEGLSADFNERFFPAVSGAKKKSLAATTGTSPAPSNPA